MMKPSIMFVAVAMLGMSGLGYGQNAAPQTDANKPVLGVWNGEMNGLPAFTLSVTDENGPLMGAIVFYLQKRVDVNHPYTATPGAPAPIFNPTFDGKTLTFQVSHRGAHPPGTVNDPPVTFKMTVSPDGKAEFVTQSEMGPITITHSEY
jgi:hypothetical protein